MVSDLQKCACARSGLAAGRHVATLPNMEPGDPIGVRVRMCGGPHHGAVFTSHFRHEEFGERVAFSVPVLVDQGNDFDPAVMWDYRSAVIWKGQRAIDMFCVGPGQTVAAFLEAFPQ